jgi:hypothetical protein
MRDLSRARQAAKSGSEEGPSAQAPADIEAQVGMKERPSALIGAEDHSPMSELSATLASSREVKFLGNPIEELLRHLRNHIRHYRMTRAKGLSVPG